MALCVVITTVDSEAAAQALAQKMVEERLAACVQILACTSHFIYEGKQEAAEEWRLELKTTDDRQAALIARIEDVHPYDVPEVIVMPVLAAATGYQAWVTEAVKAH